MKDIEADLLIANAEIRQLKAERDALQKEVLKHRAKEARNYKEHDGINYALESAINELIREVQALAEKLGTEQKISDYLRSPAQKGNW